MEPFRRLTGRAAPLTRPNVDTDAIIPSREMKLVGKAGLAAGLFANWRYLDVDARREDPAFVLNQDRFRGARILLGGPNFGCGSSREHAVWALKEYGILCVVAPSFGAIFHGNCVRNGLLPAVVSEGAIPQILETLECAEAPILTVDLASLEITAASGRAWRFSTPEADRQTLLEGLDPIGVTLKQAEAIAAFEARHQAERPWVFRRVGGGAAP